MNIKDYKKVAGLKTEDISNAINMSRSYISLVENHKEKPSINTLNSIANVFSELISTESKESIEYNLLKEYGYKPNVDEKNLKSFLEQEEVIFKSSLFKNKNIMLSDYEKQLINDFVISLIMNRSYKKEK
ncbi:helix-turn-helix transcriptional regulator [Macrococcus caseolyticus]|uniref:helix-turn-helix domain-containing protein n=1 Tax=Macrococcoides caseolyticum TaxID=69966 RepID=UPI0024BCF28F|nr:helix-turn-helix transcriptional regulator [Macrococcus caseolyticus]MDJ1156022.1 helix-turn-helix transcriptional regulator [Macrococcus caseolyticus]